MGPACTAEIELDMSHLKDGDRAGFCAFNGHSGVLTVTKQKRKYVLTMTEEVINMDGQEKLVTNVEVTERERVEFKQGTVWLRIDGDFSLGRDVATFYYSLDGQQWKRIGPDYQMRFDYQRFFMGTRYAIFCYSTRRKGGYVDVGGFIASTLPTSDNGR
jgi:beta-xylosidase